MQQLEKIFFDPTADRSMSNLPSVPTDEQITMLLSNNNARCPLTEIIVSEANEGNMRILRRFAHTALSRANRSCRGCNFGIYAGAGQGKTYIVKQWAKTIGIPFILVQSASLTDTWSLFEIIRQEISKHTFSGDSKLSRMGMLGRGAQDAAQRMLNDPHRVNGHTLFCYMMLDLWLERQAV